MATEEIDIALRLLQLIALALPAIALLMGVLVDIRQRVRDIRGASASHDRMRETKGGVAISNADSYAEFALAQWSFIFFILSSLFLILFYFIQYNILLTIGVVLIGVALVLLALSAFVMPRVTMRQTLTTIRLRLRRTFGLRDKD